MATAAEVLGIEIQYCTALPGHLLWSTQSAAVTNARASGDYHPSSGGFFPPANYLIGTSSLLLHALGLAPSKDDYWTSEVQPGSPYGNDTEPNWQLQAIVAALSTGVNGPSDAINCTNATLVMSTINGDGYTLKPDRPAITLDSLFALALTDTSVTDIRATWSYQGGYRWHYMLAVSLGYNHSLPVSDLGPALSATQYAMFDWFARRRGPLAILPATGSMISIPMGTAQPSAPSKAHPIRYFVFAPVLPGDWVMFGEEGKIVTMSTLRVRGLNATRDGFSAFVVGAAAEESVSFLVGRLGDAAASVVCPSGSGVVATLSCAAACACE